MSHAKQNIFYDYEVIADYYYYYYYYYYYMELEKHQEISN